MLFVTSEIAIEEKELEETFIRSPGPGGQNVNKVSTGVVLRFDVVHSPSLPGDVRARLLARERNRINAEGFLVIEAHTYRSQERNRVAARERLVDLIRRAALPPPPPRRPTRPTAAARARRVDDKRQRSDLKRNRKPPPIT